MLVKKNTQKSSHTQFAFFTLMPVSFLSLLMVGGVASEVSFQDEKPPHKRTSSTTTHHLVAFEPYEPATPIALKQESIESWTLRLSALPPQAEQLDQWGNVPKLDLSLSWDSIISEQQSTTENHLEEAKPSYRSTSWRFSYFSNTNIQENVEEVKQSIKIISTDFLQKYRARTQILPMGWPLKQGRVSSGFGQRGRRMHRGIDIAADKGTPIEAVEDGVVVRSETMRGYGRIVEIKHSDLYSTRYAHNSKNLVKKGEYVDKGQVIALVGSSGRSTGPHVHFEVLQSGVAINPLKYLGTMESFSLLQNLKLSEYVKLSKK